MPATYARRPIGREAPQVPSPLPTSLRDDRGYRTLDDRLTDLRAKAADLRQQIHAAEQAVSRVPVGAGLVADLLNIDAAEQHPDADPLREQLREMEGAIVLIEAEMKRTTPAVARALAERYRQRIDAGIDQLHAAAVTFRDSIEKNRQLWAFLDGSFNVDSPVGIQQDAFGPANSRLALLIERLEEVIGRRK